MEKDLVPQKNPYQLTLEELTFPGDVSQRKEWLTEVIAWQREGVEHGVQPQNLRGNLTDNAMRQWKRDVWRPWLESQRPSDQRAARLGGGQGRHTRPVVANEWPRSR